jgi:hypothetical protein
MNGTYCVPDPDGSLTEGYRGQDVLMMNVRQVGRGRKGGH